MTPTEINNIVEVFMDEHQHTIPELPSVAAAIADTNASMFGAEDIELSEIEFDGNYIHFIADMTVSGEQDPDKPFMGSKISVHYSATLRQNANDKWVLLHEECTAEVDDE